MWDDDFISNIQLPTCITKVELLPPWFFCPTWWQVVHHQPRSDCICNWCGSRAWYMICTIQLWGEIDTPHHFPTYLITWYTFLCGIVCYILNTFCFIKALRWWGVTRFA
jgi:hypothetical protein